jgi:hypothetical protein
MNVTPRWDKMDMAGGVPLCIVSMFLLINNGNTKDPSPQRSKMIGRVASRLTSSGFPLAFSDMHRVWFIECHHVHGCCGILGL